jgi:hypothetical protein
VATSPSLLLRTGAFLRDVTYDGFAPSVSALVAIAVVVIGVAAWTRWKGRTFGARFRTEPVFAVLVPYGIWAFLAQNVVEQPRHALPLVEGGLLLLGCFLSPHRTAIALVSLCAATASVPLIRERLLLPPAPAQAASWVAKNEKPEDTEIFADRSWRYFLDLPGPFPVRRRAWLSEVTLDLSRSDRLPPVVLLTSEIDLHSGMGEESLLPRSWVVEPGPSFCRDSRIDRAQPCLGLFRLSWKP